MKKYFLSFLLLSSFWSSAQIYQSYNISLLSHIQPNTGAPGIDGRLYSGCWGWYQASKNKEYGICGTSNGTYFIDVSSPANPSVSAFVAGNPNGTYREIKTYQNYCYIVSDDAPTNRFQIVDMQYLPDSVHVVHNSDSIFPRGHTIWVDQNRLYVGAVTYTNGFSAMNVYSLATPSVPLLLKKLQQDVPFINYVHDMYVKNDTIYASCGDQGLYVFQFLPSTNTFTQLGSYVGYQSHGYNHSSTLTEDGKHLLFCDEVPVGLPIHVVDVQNLSNIQPVKDFHPHEFTTPHNPFRKDNFILVSCYQDGMFIYDLKQPDNINLVGFFDTHPQGGANTGDYGSSGYRGNWGAYPYLPSGIVLANDMQNGMFVLDVSAAYTTTLQNVLSIASASTNNSVVKLFPNPVSSFLYIQLPVTGTYELQLKKLNGETVLRQSIGQQLLESLSVRDYSSGLYILSIRGENISITQKISIQH